MQHLSPGSSCEALSCFHGVFDGSDLADAPKGSLQVSPERR